MQLRNLDPTFASDAWDQKWGEIFDHYQNDLRHAYYIHAVLDGGERHVLEIAAGSFRDMAELRRRGINCEGMDFSQEAIARAKNRFPEFASYIHHMSAFAMPFADKAFDVTYHNGFWIYFSDVRIKELAKEQARISHDWMIATVHNAHNKQFVEYFEQKKIDDPLYDVRFFEIDEISELMGQVCDEIVILPVGKGKKHYEDELIQKGITDPDIVRACLVESGLQHLEISERLLCIGVVKG